MRRLYLLPLPVVVAAAVVALLALPGTAAATSCSGSVSVFSSITATHVSCSSGKSLIKKWLNKTGFPDIDPPASAKLGSYTCKMKFTSSQGEAGKLTCTASGRRKVTAVSS